jgi:hypothetical protein
MLWWPAAAATVIATVTVIAMPICVESAIAQPVAAAVKGANVKLKDSLEKYNNETIYF